MSEKQPLLFDQNNHQPPPYPVVPQSTQETPFHEQPPAYHDQGVPFPPAPQPQAAQSSQTTVVLNNNVPYAFNDTPVQARCPNCHSDVITTIKYEMGSMAWLLVLILFIIGLLLFWPAWFFCCVPCCMSSIKNVVHSCPNCDHTCGVYKRSW